MKRRRIKTDWAAVQLTEDNNVIVCHQKEPPSCLWFNSVESFKEALHGKQLKVAKWAILIPRHLCIVKTLSLPASHMEEAAKMVEFELPTLVPLPIDELVYGCSSGTAKDGMHAVTVYILKRDLLNQCLEPYQDLGIAPDRIVVDTLALESHLVSQSQQSENAVYSFLDARRSVVVSLINNRIQGLEDTERLSEDADAPALQVVGQIERYHAQIRHCSNGSPISILLEGPEQYVQSIRQNLISAAMDPHTHRVSSIRHSTLSNHEAELASDENNRFLYESSLVQGLFTLVTANRYTYANLLPADFLRKQHERRQFVNTGLLAGLIAMIVLLIWTTLATVNWRFAKKARLIEAQIDPYAEIAQDVSTKRTLITAIRQLDARRGRVSEIIKELNKYTDRTTMSFNNLIYEVHPTECLLSIDGQTNNIDEVLNLPDWIKDSQLLAGLGWSHIGHKSNQGTENRGVEFKLKCRIKD